jgi:serine/threonine protein phosphatase PrpC
MSVLQEPIIVQASSVGAREANEDRVAHWIQPGAALMAVCDGLGGHSHGEVAAEIAIEILGAAFAGGARGRIDDPTGFLTRSFAAAHAAILREAERRNLADSPRTVIAACLVQDDHAYWAHVGDSRFYLIRQGRVLERSHDHTVVQRLVDEGRIREEAVSTHPHRNRLLQCLGGSQTPRADVGSAHLAHGDVLLLCSDGFWGPLTPRHMIHSLLSRPIAEAIPELVALAEQRGGFDCDNVSVVAMLCTAEGGE